MNTAVPVRADLWWRAWDWWFDVLHRPDLGRFLTMLRLVLPATRFRWFAGEAGDQFDVDKFLYYIPEMFHHPGDHRICGDADSRLSLCLQEVLNGNGVRCWGE